MSEWPTASRLVIGGGGETTTVGLNDLREKHIEEQVSLLHRTGDNCRAQFGLAPTLRAPTLRASMHQGLVPEGPKALRTTTIFIV